jgi:hypothetical protein
LWRSSGGEGCCRKTDGEATEIKMEVSKRNEVFSDVFFLCDA